MQNLFSVIKENIFVWGENKIKNEAKFQTILLGVFNIPCVKWSGSDHVMTCEVWLQQFLTQTQINSASHFNLILVYGWSTISTRAYNCGLVTNIQSETVQQQSLQRHRPRWVFAFLLISLNLQ